MRAGAKGARVEVDCLSRVVYGEGGGDGVIAVNYFGSDHGRS